MDRRMRRILVTVVVVVVGWLVQRFTGIELGGDPSPSAGFVQEEVVPNRNPAGQRGESRSSAVERIERAAEDRESGFMVTVDAEVVKTLRDDLKGSQHQRFLIELTSGRTLLVAHNIDLAKRIPLSEGDSVRVRGQYEWNDRGGVLHWTHHDPDGRHPGGWIEYKGKRTE